MDKEIKIVLTLENGEQATAVLKMVNSEYEHVQKTSEALKANPMMKEFARDLLNIGAVSKEASEGISEFIRYNDITEKQIQQVITSLKAEQSNVGILSEAYKKYEVAIQNITNATNQALNKSNQFQNSSLNSTKQVGQQFTGMNQVIGQTGFLLSDMDMFFRSNDWATNVRMGAMSVSNNFSMIGQTVANAMRQATVEGITWQAMLRSSLTGINAWILGLNAGLVAIQFATRFFISNTEKIKENREELKKLQDAYNNYTLTTAKNQKELKELELAQLDKMPGKKGEYYMGKFVEYGGAVKYSDPEKAAQLQNEIAALDRVIFLTNDLSDAEKRLGVNRTKQKQITRENFDALVPTTAISKDLMEKWGDSELRFTNLRERNYLRAKAQLDAWVKEDEKITEKQKEQKTLAEQLHIKTNDQLDIEIEKLKTLLHQTKTLEDQLRIRDTIKKLELEKTEPLLITPEEVLSKGFSDKAPTDEKKLREAIYGKLKEIPKSQMPDHPFVDTKKKADSLTQAVTQFGSAMTSAVANGITGFRSLNEVMMSVLGTIIQIGLRLAIKEGLSLIPGVGPLIANLRMTSIPTATPTNISSNNAPVMLLVRVEGKSKTQGRDIYTSYNNTSQLVAAFK